MFDPWANILLGGIPRTGLVWRLRARKGSYRRAPCEPEVKHFARRYERRGQARFGHRWR